MHDDDSTPSGTAWMVMLCPSSSIGLGAFSFVPPLNIFLKKPLSFRFVSLLTSSFASSFAIIGATMGYYAPYISFSGNIYLLQARRLMTYAPFFLPQLLSAASSTY